MSGSSKPIDRARRRPPVAFFVVGAVVAVLAVLAVWGFWKSDDRSTTNASSTTGGGIVVLPQNPSLALVEQDGIWQVENDGNVTMSDVKVSDNGGQVICELGTLSPEESVPCDAAAGIGQLMATGHGPQGQPVEVSAG